ncbi:uncharacterized protein LAESUDRAFT_715939 [Laetiporus sulphureus 93-53]|uniref:Uncharacterized protein n=1 Tax=Laetiporus sulphureus 93-53 TaxID=1314785 RepID=A0A165CYS0_9APHY|nr:uncharacterized protein LAESUDRAFT_715939 [Laetiporus sulphureus 93-53]KZT03766.1 hypothetical protein LAESUDRAFT_715939 [Laetiporus sulphureus 93-53]
MPSSLIQRPASVHTDERTDGQPTYTWEVNWPAFTVFFCEAVRCITGFIGAVSPHSVSTTAQRLSDLKWLSVESMDNTHLDRLETFIRDAPLLDESVERKVVAEKKNRINESLSQTDPNSRICLYILFVKTI